MLNIKNLARQSEKLFPCNGRKTINKLKTFIFLSLMFLYQPIQANATYSISTSGYFRIAFDQFKQQYSIFITIFMSIMTLTSVAVFIYHCLMLAASTDNAQKRTEAINNLLITGCCLSAQSAISLIISLTFWGFYI